MVTENLDIDIDNAAHYFRVAMLGRPAVVEVKIVAKSVIAVVDFGGRDVTLLTHINQVVDNFPSMFPGVGFSVEPLGGSYTVDHMRGREEASTIVVPTIVR